MVDIGDCRPPQPAIRTRLVFHPRELWKPGTGGAGDFDGPVPRLCPAPATAADASLGEVWTRRAIHLPRLARLLSRTQRYWPVSLSTSAAVTWMEARTTSVCGLPGPAAPGRPPG